MKKKILNILRNSKDEYISGERLSEELGITRAGIWKHIKNLKESGYVIESISNRGYRLVSTPDIIDGEEILPFLTTKYMGRSFIHYDEVDSTNVQCRKECSNNPIEGMMITAEEQTSGKGRLGRSWVSPKGTGIWMSIVLKPNISPMVAPRATLIGAAAVYTALKDMGISVGIKWPNDIVINGKKICGILTEMNAEIERVNYVIMGIGINVNMESFPEELKEKATSLKNELGNEVDRKRLVANILNNLEDFYEDFKNTGDISRVIGICREGSILINKEVRVINGNDEVICTVIDIDDDGELIVNHKDGTVNRVISGEVSVRGIYGYV
ncbi:biotin--[acetyl-CoA-carboxylase] ligase [Clostridium sp.]|uniref:biotin--[acetyl-CoA-carboxylase] ligase n=1 Tax=Clostridium sp. TaxID=1506 RepID=UPI003217293F